MEKTDILMLGTGHATVRRCYNTCFVLRQGDAQLLLDAGGGNGILNQLEKAGMSIADIHHLFITHTHTDHILGCVWVVRMVIQYIQRGWYEGQLHVYSHRKGIDTLRAICEMTMHKMHTEHIGREVVLHTLTDGESFTIPAATPLRITAFDIHSDKEPQFGFRAELADGQVLVCLGDEPYCSAVRHWVERADWLLCEAFCLYRDRDVFHPYEKFHRTALDAGRLAEALNVKHLLLYHTEDSHLDTRKNDYSAEAKLHFSGIVVVPDDLETVPLS